MTPGQLVDAVAKAMDVAPETVAVHDRNLVTAGLRTKGGRGLSAAKVTYQDAARLMVAVLTSVKPKDTVPMLQAFEQLRFDPPEQDPAKQAAEAEKAKELGIWLPSGVPPKGEAEPAIEGLPADHSLTEAVASLIAAASTIAPDQERYLKRFVALSIKCESPWARASIYNYDRPRRFVAHYRKPSRPAVSGTREAAEPTITDIYTKAIGIRQKREATGSAIVLLGMAFREGGLENFSSGGEAMDNLLGIKPARKSKRKAA